MCSDDFVISQIPKVTKKHSIIKVLSDISYSVFALGSRAYPNFCEFGHTVADIFKKLGGDEVYPIGEGDELNGQEESFKNWARECFKVRKTLIILLNLSFFYCSLTQSFNMTRFWSTHNDSSF